MAVIKVPETPSVPIGAPFCGSGGGSGGPVDAEDVRYTKTDEPDVDNVKEGLDAALDKADAAFAQASDGRAAIAGGIGAPALATDTHAQLAGQIEATKMALAANLTTKGVNALSSEALAELAAKVNNIAAGWGQMETIILTASQTWVVPDGCERVDIFLLGGGAGAPNNGNYSGSGGGSCRKETGIPVIPGTGYPAIIGSGGGRNAAGGATSFLGFTAEGGVVATSATQLNTAQRLWLEDGGVLVAGAGRQTPQINTTVSPATLGDLSQARAGGAFAVYLTVSGGSKAMTTSPAPSGMGGGGAMAEPGGSGRIEIRAYFKPPTPLPQGFEFSGDYRFSGNMEQGALSLRSSGLLTIPNTISDIDVFVVGAGGGAGDGGGGGGGGRTKTFKRDASGWRDGPNITLSQWSDIDVLIGAGGAAANGNNAGGNGGFSQFLNATYRAEGGIGNTNGGDGGSGGSGGGSWRSSDYTNDGGTDGSNGFGLYPGIGQGHTTRAFGEASGDLYAGGGGSCGGGSAGSPGGIGGDGGGGTGAIINMGPGEHGAPNTGGGAGSGYNNGGGNGGSGIVIIRWGY